MNKRRILKSLWVSIAVTASFIILVWLGINRKDESPSPPASETKPPQVVTLLPRESRSFSIFSSGILLDRVEEKPFLGTEAELEGILANPDLPQREEDLKKFFESWAPTDPLTALQVITDVEYISSSTRNSCVRIVFQSLAKTRTPSEVWELATSLEVNRRIVAQATLVRYLSESDLESALHWFDQIRSLEGQNQSVEALTSKLIEADPLGALTWIDQIRLKDVQGKAILECAKSITMDSTEVRNALKGVTSPYLRETLIRYEAEQTVRSDFNALLDWADTLSHDEQGKAVRAGFFSVINRDLNRALQLARTHPDLVTSSIWRRFTDALARRNRDQASDWVLEQDPALASHTVRPLMNDWLRDDSLEASQWAVDLEPGEAREHAARAITEFLIREGDYDDARIWLQEVRQPGAIESLLNKFPED